MSSGHDLDALGWSVRTDEAAGELRIEHPEADTTYVLDENGGIRVPGEGEIGRDLHALQETLTAALDEPTGAAATTGEAVSSGDTEAPERGTRSGGGANDAAEPSQEVEDVNALCNSAITCGQGGSTVTIQPTARLEIDAPTVTISANVLDIESDGNATVEASGVISLDGSLINLN